ncbi:hypothetical protein QJS04_geneDACA012385 [Acorus gramineus]|uniref:DUF632 domain-containing protein n=1 Tax=Acorus gramineus TaxID=55184 RepID=A0AAV9BAN4_ACOGR|nr:hypothetical protein QJS04_geneDACA012385 [Acorus gramineus]
MGCTQSKFEEEAVARCKDRKIHMREAVAARNAFAAAHSSYTVSLKNTGAALSDYGQGEVIIDPNHPSSISSPAAAAASSSSAAAAAASIHHPQPPLDNLPPPPPLPNFSPAPLQRSISMPDLPPKSNLRSDPSQTIQEEDDDDEDEEAESAVAAESPPRTPPPPPSEPDSRQTPPPPPPPENKAWDFFFRADEDMPPPSLEEPEIRLVEPVPETPPPPPPPPPQEAAEDKAAAKRPKQSNGNVHHQHAASASAVPVTSAERGKRGNAVVMSSLSLMQVLRELDDQFLKASESAHEVSKMLEANRLHYHSNFADNRGHIDHSARVMRVITWNRSFRGIPNGDDGKDDFDSDESETLATVLDKLLAWEKKLYDEVKAGELMKIEYQRKVALLNKQKKRNANPEALEKTKAAVSHLHTRYIVDMQSMDSTVSEIQRLRDAQLYPKLVNLVDGMAKMWQSMWSHHKKQLDIVMSDLRHVTTANSPKETSIQHHHRTDQIYKVLGEWSSQFEKLITHQREYIQSLNNWLKLNLVPIESSLKEKVSSPPRVQRPPILPLLQSWNEHLEKLPYEIAKSAMHSFTAVVNTIMVIQQDEAKQKEKCEEVKKEYVKKSRAFEDWNMKYQQRKVNAPSEDGGAESGEGGTTSQKDPLSERMYLVDAAKKRWEEEAEEHQKQCKHVREKSLASLKTHLPELFRALSEFAYASSELYKNLISVSQSQNQADHNPN